MAEETTPKFSIVKLIPVTAVITVMSQISTLLYYDAFNFNPIGYIDSVELITNSIKDFIIIGIALLLFAQSAVLSKWRMYITKYIYLTGTKHYRKIINEERITGKRSTKADPFDKFLIFLQVIVVALFILCIVFGDSLTRRYSLIFLVFFLVIHLLANAFSLNQISRRKRNINIDIMFPYIDPVFIAVSGIILSVMILFSGMKSTYIMFENPYEETTIVTNHDEIIVGTPKSMLVGKCEKYYFLYNRVDSSMRVLKRDDIKIELIKSTDKIANIFFRF